MGLLDYDPFGATTDVTFGGPGQGPAYTGMHPGIAAYQHQLGRGYLEQRQQLVRDYYAALAGGASAAQAQQALGRGAAAQQARVAGAGGGLAQLVRCDSDQLQLVGHRGYQPGG